MRLKSIPPAIVILILMSCSDVNKVKTDGIYQLNGKAVRALYVTTDKEIHKIKAQLIHQYGQPANVSTDGALIWNIRNSVIGGFTITSTIYFDSISHMEGSRKVIDFIKVTEYLTDQEGNDLMTKGTVSESGRRNLQEIIDAI